MNEQISTTKCVTWAFTPSFIQFQQLLTWITSHALSVNKSNYTYLVQQNRVLPPPSTSWPVHVLPLHTFDMWALSQLENCREESAFSLCWLLRCTHWTAVTPVFMLLPVSCALMCDRAHLARLHLFTLEWTGVTWEWDSFQCILKLTNMCSAWHQYYLPAPDLVLPGMLLEKAPVKVAGRVRKNQTRFDPAWRSNFFVKCSL